MGAKSSGEEKILVHRSHLYWNGAKLKSDFVIDWLVFEILWVSKTMNQTILTCKSNRKSRAIHAGMFILIINISGVIFIGIQLEQEFGSCFTGSLMPALFVQDIPEVGSSGALLGLLVHIIGSTMWCDWNINGGDKEKYIAVSILNPAIEIWDLNLIQLKFDWSKESRRKRLDEELKFNWSKMGRYFCICISELLFFLRESNNVEFILF
ncbi:hypothetical protein MKX03_021856 [Papaver bracteatum]|nr:hypothetical protein MKX03_021856 [Papaver bracteatum]